MLFLCLQAVVPYFTQQILGYGNARRATDLFSIAPYFGATFTTAAQAAEVKRLGTAGVLAWLRSPAGANGKPSNAVLGYGSLADVDAAVAAQVAAARAFGVNLTSYEGVRIRWEGGDLLVIGAQLGWLAQQRTTGGCSLCMCMTKRHLASQTLHLVTSISIKK